MNGILCINKPQDWTSFDVVNAISKKHRVKAGHTGTLDPQATGVLVLLINQTKVLPYLDMSTKRYTATCQLGLKTDTGDSWGKIIQEKPIQTKLTEALLNETLKSFIGLSTQVVPMTSAKKFKGRKLYDYQRNNEIIEPLVQKIEIFEIELISFTDTEFTFSALVSSGTYIRALCEDLATQLNEIGTMSSLVRTQAGKYSIKDCVSIEEALESLKCLPIEDGLTHYPKLEVNEPNNIYHGKRIEHEFMGEQILVSYQNKALAIYQFDEISQNYKSQRGLWQ